MKEKKIALITLIILNLIILLQFIFLADEADIIHMVISILALIIIGGLTVFLLIRLFLS